MKIEINTPDDYIGAVTGDLNAGEVVSINGPLP
jgi:translation elongation factor EF-G